MTSVEILTVRIIFVVLITALIVYGIFKHERESRMNKIWKEAIDLVTEKFHKEVEYTVELWKTQQTALLKIKAIFNHLGIKIEITDGEFTPSIDTLRSLSFVKEYLPEIDEQLRIYKDAENEINRLETFEKRSYVITWLEEALNHRKWRKNRWTSVTTQAKLGIIDALSETYDYRRNSNNDQENLTE